MTSNSFDGLVGIQAPREIAVHTASKLVQLVSVGNKIIEKYYSVTRKGIKGIFYAHHETYTAIEAELADSELEYDISDLQALVRAYCNRDDSKEEAITRGMYTGALASVLTKRNREKGERTHIYLNGDGNTFSHLLYYAHTLDELTIENFRGDYIAAHTASHGGTANNITLANITGFGVGGDIASHRGRVGTVTLANIKGDNAGSSIASYKGRVGAITLANIAGNEAGRRIVSHRGRVGVVTLANITGDRAGSGIVSNKGRVGTVTLANITGDNAGGGIALGGGRVGTVTLANITGNEVGGYIARDHGRVGLLLAVNNGENYFKNNRATRTITSLNEIANAQQIQSLIDTLGQQDKAPQHYAAASKQLGELLRAEP